MFWNWIDQFHEKYLSSYKQHDLVKDLYVIGHNGYENKINADVGGNVTKSLMDSNRLLGVEQMEMATDPKDKDSLEVEQISFQEENITILLEICKFYGRDINIMEMYALFENILKKGKGEHEYNFNKDQIRVMFLQALKDLKYMGYVSQTKISTFIFKKNYYGKAKHQKTVNKNQEQKDREKFDASRQFGINI